MPANFYLAPRAGLDDFSGTEIGRAKHARRARATEGASQPAKLVRDGSEKFGEGRGEADDARQFLFGSPGRTRRFQRD